jgi:hypothetical protein
MIKKIEVERFTLSSSKPFDQVVAALIQQAGGPLAGRDFLERGDS